MKRLTYDLFIALLVLVGVACQRHDEMEIEEKSETPLTMGMFGLSDIASRETETGAFIKGESVKVTADKNGVKTSAVYSLVADGTDSLWKRTALDPLYYVEVKDADSFTVESWGGKAPVDDAVPYLNQRSQENYLKSDYTVGQGTLIAADGVNPISIHNHQLDATLDHQFTDVRVSIKNESSSIINILCTNLLNKKGSKTLSYGAGQDIDGKDRYWGIVHPDSIPDLGADFIQVGYAFKTKPADTLYVEARLANTAFDGISDLKGERLNISLVFNNEKLIFEILTLEEWVETEMEGDVTDIVPIIYDEKLDLFKIYLAEGMKIFADIVNSTNKQPVIGWTSTPYPNKIPGANGKLMRDVSLLKYMGGTGWTPIGNRAAGKDEYRYSGHFDGNNKLIKHLKINRTTNNNQSDWQGLFGVIINDASIKNVILVGPDVVGRRKVGCLVGSMTTGTRVDSCRIISTESVIAQATAIGENDIADVGLLAGNVNGIISITDCTVEGGGLVKGLNGTTDRSNVGGLVGYIKGVSASAEAVIERCTTDITVVAGRSHIGGMVGESGNYGRFIDCELKTATISAVGTDVAGMVGFSTDIYVDGCSANTYYIVDDKNTGSLTSTGGMFGYTNARNISNCKSVIYKMEGNVNVGGLIANYDKSGGVVSDCEVQIDLYIQGRTRHTGGLIGVVRGGSTIKNCKVKTSATGMIKGISTTSVYTRMVGGLVGASEKKNTIMNCEVDVNAIYGGYMTGGLIGGEYSEGYGAASSANEKVSDCTVKVNNIVGNGDYVGGFMGYAQPGSKMLNNKVTIRGKVAVNSNSNYCGGFVGGAEKNKNNTHTKFTDCEVQGEVFGTHRVGGFVGNTTGNCDFTRCKSIGNVRGKGQYTGGFTGIASTIAQTKTSSVYTECSHEGDVLGENLSFQKQSYVGGFVGYLGAGQTITNCTTKGDISGNAYVGGFVGICELSDSNADVVMTENTYESGTVLASASSVGGFWGYLAAKANSTSSVKVSKCDASASTVMARNGNIYGYEVGGFGGRFDLLGEGSLTVSECVPSKNTIKGCGYMGGLIGYMVMSKSSSLTVEKCTAAQDIVAELLSASKVYCYGGLIGCLSSSSTGTVRLTDNHAQSNLSMNNGAANSMGGVVGSLTMTDGVLNISKCDATGNVDEQGNAYDYGGGFVGVMAVKDATISECWASGNVRVTSGTNSGGNGGFIGCLTCQNGGSLSIEKCKATGVFDANHPSYNARGNGGFIGHLYAGDSTNATTGIVSIKECTSEGAVKLMGCGTGGFLGIASIMAENSKIEILNCEMKNDEIVCDTKGNDIGYQDAGLGGFCGYLLGTDGEITVKNCKTAVQNIDAKYVTSVGGFVGLINGGKITVADCETAAQTVGGEQSIGGFVGKISSTSAESDIQVLRCKSSAAVNGNALVGGFIGVVGSGTEWTGYGASLITSAGGILGSVTIGECEAAGDVVSTTHGGDSTNLYYGGFLGFSNVKTVNGLKIYGCCAKGNVTNTVNARYTVGGFAGSISVNTQVIACYSTGDVTAGFAYNESYGNYAGGFAAYTAGVVKSCYSTGKVQITNTTEPPLYVYYGGFAAGMMKGNATSEVSNCAATGEIYWRGAPYTKQAFCGRAQVIWDGDASPYDPMLPNPLHISGYSTPTNYTNIADASNIYGIVTGGTAESFSIDGMNYSTDSGVWIDGSGPTLWWE